MIPALSITHKSQKPPKIENEAILGVNKIVDVRISTQIERDLVLEKGSTISTKRTGRDCIRLPREGERRGERER